MKAGYLEIEFNAQHLSSGIYFYRIEAAEFQDVKNCNSIRLIILSKVIIG